MQQPVYTQVDGSYNQTGSPVANEINKANDRNATIAFWLSIGSLVLMFGSRFSLLVNVFSFTLAIKYGLVSRKKGLAIASIVINSVVIAVTAILIFASI
jgi:heme/copper-type cytochrome/quinol oxidase subunit 3